MSSTPHSPEAHTRPMKTWPWVLLSGSSMVWLLAAMYGCSHIEVDMLSLGLIGVVLAALWTVMTLLEPIRRIRVDRARRSITRRCWIFWLTTPLVGLAGLWLAWTDADLLLRIRLSEPALTTRAQQLLDSEKTEPQQIDEWIGLFHVKSAQVNEDGTVKLTMQWPGIFTETGMIYDPNRIVSETAQWPEDRHRLSQSWLKYIWSD